MKWILIILSFIFISCGSQKPIMKEDSSKKYRYEIDTISKIDESKNELKEENLQTEMAVGSHDSNNQLHKTNLVVKTKTKVVKETKKSNLGQILYKVPDTMQVMKNYEVIVRISRSETNVEIKDGLDTKVIQNKITTSSKMEVQLKDPTGQNFDIIEINSADQMVDSSYTEWRYNVKPIKSGQNQLMLIVSIFIGDDVKQTVFSDQIWVKSNPKAQIGTFWQKNWQWSMDKILIPIVTFLFGIWFSKRKKKKP
jgi:hypothetical protein